MRRSAFRSLAVVAFVVAVTGVPAAAGPPSVASPDPSPRPASPAPDAPGTFFPIAPGTSATPTGLDWQAVGPERRRQSWMSRLATWEGGFAVLDADAGRALVRTSIDGVDWVMAPLPRFQGWDRELVAFDGGLALLTSTYSEGQGESMRFDVWRSPDGVAWERAGGLVVRPPPGCLAGVGDLAVVQGHLQVTGHLCTPPCCGLGPGPAFAGIGDVALAGSVPPQRVVAWTSRDGRRWDRKRVRFVTPDGRREPIVHLETVDAAPAGLLAVPERGLEAVLASEDGRTWTELAPFPDGYTPWGENRPRTIVASGVLLVGEDAAGAGIWRLEPDGSTWTRAAASIEETATHGVAADGAVVIVSGVVRESYGRSDAFGWTLVSTDGGRTFDPALAWTGPLGSCVRDVAVHAGVAVMIDCTDDRSGLWRAALP